MVGLALVLSNLSFAQFAIVADKDGFSNIRDSAGLESKVVDTLHNGHFVYCFKKIPSLASMTQYLSRTP